MKKLFVLLSLFVIAVAIALGIVINEQQRRSSSAPVLNESQPVSSAGSTAAESGKTNAAIPAATTEGNIFLTVTAPPNNSTTSDSTVTITGTTTPGANVMINEYELTAGANGSFAKTVALDDGENYFSVVAYTAGGYVAEQELVVVKNVSNY